MSTPTSHRKPGIDEIEADIARTREELADTVDELAARLDVKSRVQEQLPAPAVLGAAAAAVALVVAVIIWRRRR